MAKAATIAGINVAWRRGVAENEEALENETNGWHQ
jgi:hypothetical protein